MTGDISVMDWIEFEGGRIVYAFVFFNSWTRKCEVEHEPRVRLKPTVATSRRPMCHDFRDSERLI